jgi:hypothetical protein
MPSEVKAISLQVDRGRRAEDHHHPNPSANAMGSARPFGGAVG